MIHVDVRTNPRRADGREFEVQTSVDGGPWISHWLCYERTRAETLGRCFSSGVAFGIGHENVRLTMFGESHPVPACC